MNIKKRIISMTLCLVMVMTAFPLTDISEIFPVIVASAEGETYYGDLNENGRVEASDARLVLQKAASLITLTDRQMRLADCNQDGKITAIDARTALRTAARLETPIVFESAEIITQGEFITNLMNELGFAGTGNAEQFFENVTPGDECFDAVQAAVEWGILDADSDFDPDKEATVDFTIDIATAALQYDNIAEDIILTDSSTDRTEDCSKDTATEIIQKAKEYRLNEEPEAEFENIVIKDTVETFDASEITAVSESEFTFNSFGDEAPQNGDIFIAESEKGQTAEKIVSVAENSDGTYSVTTVQPDMDEVFDDFSFVDTATPDIDEISFTPAPGAFVIDDADDFEMLAEGRKKDEDKDVFGIALSLNSTDTPGMLPDMCCTLSSDYIDALNMTAENKDVPSRKKILEDYNQKIDLLTGGDGKTTAVATPVKKYESGWTLDAAIKFSNFEVNFDFKDFWTKGNYSISFLADVTEYIDFEGTLNAEKHLGTLHFSHGIQRIFFDVDIELYAYIDINGKVVVSGQGKIVQTYGNFDGKTDTLNNNAFKPHLEANINAEAGIKVCPGISTLGFELAEVGIQIGLNGNADFKATLMVEYNDSLYYYAGDVLNLPDGLSMTFLGCLTLELSYPIVRVSVSAGEDVKKQIEKMKKKNEELPDIPLDHTFEICTLSEKSLLTPITNSVHMELANELNTVDKCTADSYGTLAHMCSGYVVKKDTDEVLPDTTVELIDKNDKVVSSATTDINGEFDLKFIPFGEYSIRITSDGNEVTLDKKVTIDKNESNIGKLEFEVDLIRLYAEQVNKSMEIFHPHTPDTHKYIGAVICNMISSSSTPELAIIYYEGHTEPIKNDYFVIHLYEYKNNKVSFVDYYIESYYGTNDMMLWQDPLSGNFALACASTYSEGWKFYQYNLLSSTKQETLFEDHCWHGYQHIDSRYEKYIKFIKDYEKYTIFHFGTESYKFDVYTANGWYDYSHHLFGNYTYPSDVKIHVVNDNGTYEIKTFSF